MVLTLSLTLKDQILNVIPVKGMTWEMLMEHLPDTDPLALQKCVRELAESGDLTIVPDLLVRKAHITKTKLEVMDVSGEMFNAIPPCGITWGDLKRALPPETQDCNALVMLATLQAGEHIKITPQALLNDDSVIERITEDDKVVAFISRRKTA
jgi:hypothetical protein